MNARVVHVSSVHRASDPRIFEKECTSLARAGYDVTLIATGEVPPRPGFPVHSLPVPGSRPARMLLGGTRAILRAVRLKPDLVHLHDPELIPFIPLLRAAGIRVVFDSHEDIPATMLRKPYLRPAARRVMEVFGRLLVGLADRASHGIVVATPSIAAGYSRAPQCLVQNFPILDDWRMAGVSTSPRLVYVGGISEVRGAHQMMDVIATLGPKYGAHLLLAGPVSEQLHSQLRAHPGWQYTDHVGMLDRGGVAELLANCTIGVVIFQPEPNHVDSQPTKMFEYMAAGLPVLGSDFPLWRRLVVDHDIGLLADPNDPDAITAAAEALITDPGRAHDMGQRGRRVVEETRNWRLEGERLVNFYDQLLGGSQ